MTEATFTAILEALWLDDARCVPELGLAPPGPNNFVDLIILECEKTSMNTPPVIVLELRNVSLPALWNGRYGDVNIPANDIDISDLETFRDQLKTESEETLLNRNYRYWDVSANQWQTETLLVSKETALSQVWGYMSFIKRGPASERHPGILDARLRCAPGKDRLHGYVMMCIGGTRVFVWDAGIVQTNYSYIKSK
jgi:hypothetical protein